MSKKREQRLRRKAKALLRTTERMAEQQLAELTKLRIIAHAAIRYVSEIDAPNPHEPFAIANRRDELRDLVHVHQGRPRRGERKEPSAVRAAAPVVPLAPANLPVARFPTQPLPPKKETKMSSVDPKVRRELCFREVELRRRELHAAAAKYGAEANKRGNRDAARVAELATALDNAGRAFARAEQKLAEADSALRAA